jgi:hypothetical protein
MSKEASPVAAPFGQRMIEVTVRFYTNGIALGQGKILPKHAWTEGVVTMEKNEAHGIKSGANVQFNSRLQIPLAIERALIHNGIALHPSTHERKYMGGPVPGGADKT